MKASKDNYSDGQKRIKYDKELFIEKIIILLRNIINSLFNKFLGFIKLIKKNFLSSKKIYQMVKK